MVSIPNKGRIGIFIALAVALVYSTVADAQTSNQNSQFGPDQASLSILSDPVTYATVSPGDSTEGIIRVRNGDSVDHTIVSKIRDWIPGTDPGSVVLLEQGKSEQPSQQSPYPLAAYTTVSPTQQLIKAKQEFEFHYKISIPEKGAAPGGHYGAVGFSIDNTPSVSSESGVAISPRLYKLFFITVPGDVHYAAKITKFRVKRAKDIPLKSGVTQPTQNVQLLTTTGYKFLTTVSNDGNVHFKPKGFHVKISSVFGNHKTVDIPDPEASSANVLPHSQRTFTTNWPHKLSPGFYLAKVEFVYGADNGPFLHVTATRRIIVMPPWWFWIILLLIAIAIWMLTRSRKRIRRAMRAFRDG